VELLWLKGAGEWGRHSVLVRVSKHRGISTMKMIIMVTAAFLAMQNVAAAADLPIGKYRGGGSA
jgi:hypothetical protein